MLYLLCYARLSDLLQWTRKLGKVAQPIFLSAMFFISISGLNLNLLLKQKKHTLVHYNVFCVIFIISFQLKHLSLHYCHQYFLHSAYSGYSGGRDLLSQGATAVVHGCSVCVLGTILVNPYMLEKGWHSGTVDFPQ